MPVIPDPPDGLQSSTDALAGRGSELRALTNLLVRTIGGRGSAALISGAAGIGKTALVEGLMQEAVACGALVLSGGCFDLTATPPYGPWLEMERSFGQIETLPALPDRLSVESGMQTSRNQADLFDEFDRFLAAVAAQRTLVLILEDLHWADPASIDLLRVVARECADLPLLLIATYRSEDLDRWSYLSKLLPIIVREAKPQRIELRPLDRHAIGDLVDKRYRLSPDDRERLIDYLMRRAEGNPFYTLELLRGLEQQDLLVSADDAWVLHDIESLEVPQLLRQVIDARLTRLEPEVQQHLAVGAVIGQNVPIKLWGETLEISETEILLTIERAVAAQLIDASEDGISIRFRHALIRDALYQSILPLRRRRLHHRIGLHLAQSPTPDPDAVAWHLRVAGDEDAAEWLIRASEHAQRSYAWTTAAERLIAAEGLLSDRIGDRDRGWLRYRISRLRRHAEATDAIRWLQAAEGLGNRSNDPVLAAFSRFDLGHLLVLTGDYRRGIAEMIAGDQMLEQLSVRDPLISPEVIAWITDSLPGDSTSNEGTEHLAPGARASVLRRGTLVQWLVEPGRFKEALDLGEAYIKALDSSPHSSVQILSSAGDAWFGLGRTYAAFGDVDTARNAFEQALSFYERMDHHLLVASTLRVELTELLLPFNTTQGEELQRVIDDMETSYHRATGALPSRVPPGFGSLEFLILRGSWERALELLEPLVEHRGTMASWRHRAAALLARMAREQGDPDRAWGLTSDVLPNGPQTDPGGTTFSRAIELQFVAIDLALDRSQHDVAYSWLVCLDRWLAWNGARRWASEAELAWARFSLVRCDWPSARQRAVEAMRLAGDPLQPLALLSAHRFLAQLDLAEDRLAEAEQHLADAIALAEACDAPYERALTALALAETLFAAGDFDTARQMISDQTGIFERLGALPALERARSLAAMIDEPGQDDIRPFGLSPREIEVLRLVSQGLTDAEVAERLFISYRTVTTHLTSIFNKLGVGSRVSATRVAVEHKIV